MDLEKYKNLAFFNSFCDSDLRILGPYFTPQTWVAGTVVFKQGDYADYLYLVVRGEVVIHYKPDDGPSMTLAHIQPGGIFGWSAAIHNPCYTSGAACILDSEVLRIRGLDLRMMSDKHPELGKIILDRLAGVIAERKRSQQKQVTSMLASGLGQQDKQENHYG